MINMEIIKRQVQPSPVPCSVGESTPDSKTAQDYVEYREHFFDNTDRDLLLAECETLNFSRRAKSDAVQNRFLSSGKDPYNWNSSGGQVVNNPLNFEKFPAIKRLLDKVNQDFNCSLNSGLVSFYKNGTVNARLHRDDEASLDQSQPIIVLSIGAVRRVEFVDNNQESFRSNALVLEPKECSVYVMRPGCQERLRHRVRMDRRIKESRISISFRAFIPESDRVAQVSNPDVTPKRAASVTPDYKQPSSSPNTVTVAGGLSNSNDHFIKELHKKFPGLALPAG